MPVRRNSDTAKGGIPAVTSRRRVLVVDDQSDVADTFAAVLQVLGQDVVVAYNAEEALEAARRAQPEVLFVDLSMPGMGGYELARRLREELLPRPVTLVAVTGHPRGAGERADQEPLFEHHLLKPAKAAQLAELLNSLTAGEQ